MASLIKEEFDPILVDPVLRKRGIGVWIVGHLWSVTREGRKYIYSLGTHNILSIGSLVIWCEAAYVCVSERKREEWIYLFLGYIHNILSIRSLVIWCVVAFVCVCVCVEDKIMNVLNFLRTNVFNQQFSFESPKQLIAYT